MDFDEKQTKFKQEKKKEKAKRKYKEKIHFAEHEGQVASSLIYKRRRLAEK